MHRRAGAGGGGGQLWHHGCAVPLCVGRVGWNAARMQRPLGGQQMVPQSSAVPLPYHFVSFGTVYRAGSTRVTTLGQRRLTPAPFSLGTLLLTLSPVGTRGTTPEVRTSFQLISLRSVGMGTSLFVRYALRTPPLGSVLSVTPSAGVSRTGGGAGGLAGAAAAAGASLEPGASLRSGRRMLQRSMPERHGITEAPLPPLWQAGKERGRGRPTSWRRVLTLFRCVFFGNPLRRCATVT